MTVWAFIWLGVAILAAVVEGLTVQMVSIWFAISAVVTAVGAFLGLPVYGQVLLFSCVALVLLLGTRPFVKKVLKVQKIPTNADALIGKTASVLADGHRVLADGQDWAVRVEPGISLAEGQSVRILAIEGVKLFVRPLEAGER